jgi:signal transduction histidine kinase/DNA-binding response OmpR family regulator
MVNPLAGGGEMGALMRSIDWSRTAVGPVEGWPQSLRTALSILLETGFPMYIAWSPDFIQFYNDGYRPILGSTKHPAAMGLSTRVTFAEIWDIIGPMFQGVMRGTPTTLVDFLLPLDRHGFVEECYFIFSYSPIREEGGGVGGVLVTVTETTERVLGARRLKTLQELASRTQKAATAEAACETAAGVLRENPDDLPFGLVYLFDAGGRGATLAGVAGLEPGSPASPAGIDLEGADPLWPLADVLRTGEARVLEDLPAAAGPLPARRAVVVPIAQPGEERPAGALVAAASPRLLLDESYRGFFALAAGQIATAVSNARALAEARARAEALAELDRAKTAFFSNVSHELRTPLTLILGPAEDALREAGGAQAGDTSRWELVHRNALRLLKLVNTLLDFSRLEAGRVQASYEPADLATLTRELASAFHSAIESAGLRYALDVAPLDEPVYVDRDMWEKIVLNLLSNALKFTFEGEIEIALRRQDDRALLTVRDTGTGVSADQIPLLFDRFHRVPGVRSRTHEGTGIGLSLVRELARLHGGSVTVESAVGRGSTFTVAIPFGSAHLPPDRLAAPREAGSTAVSPAAFVEEALRWSPEAGFAAAPARGAERILLADDNADMRDYVTRLLRGRWAVETAADGATALERALEAPPDLILSDVMMPGLDGHQLLRALRADERTRAIPVIFLSARAGEEARVEGLSAGADDYLVKPFSARELLARVGTHLELSRLRRDAERSRARLYTQLMQAPVPVCAFLGPGLVYDLANPRYERMVGRTGIVGRPIREVFPELPDDAPIFQALEGVYASGEPYTAEEFLVPLDVQGDGTVEDHFFKLTAQPMRDAAGQVFGVIAVAVDVTGQVRARREVEVANRSKDEFLAMLGHELRNPLAPIVTALQLMELRGDETLRRERTIIERQVRHLTRLVDDLLDVSRITRGRIDLKRESIEVSEIVAKAIEMASPLIEQRQHNLRIDLPRHGLAVEADAIRMAQVVANLLNNAAKYTEPHGTIAVAARMEGELVVLRVRDTGIGLSPEMLPRVFDLFVQERQALDRAQGGLGLGLAIVKTLVELHGGTVEAHSEGHGRGSEFVVRLPAAQAGGGLAPAAPEAAARPDALRVLVVDDNADAADLLALSVRLMGHVARVANDGPAALQIAAQFQPAVALLDIGLPVMDGYELARHLRALPGLEQVRLIAVTGYSQEADRRHTTAAGFERHLVKPIQLDELQDALSQLRMVE